ncbi:flagellar type III secretion system pore protein FliP [Calorimonas adulescens]|uniref:Flagellar biosynthetic protein FliP n=1 Tax=Calorimonas adulescens TaxID=2606906 RepID=A0A5D8QFQ9_9THEO|nr:flagellar type III secretion system pore protein FliP [Calorimonas adulescens]TZE83341.1 flagellar type III secretion system pore protein FliP [Calorimonas adulescens]
MQNTIPPNISINISPGSTSGLAPSLYILLILTIITLSPSLLIMLTSFTRIIIVLSFTRSALGTQQVPSNQVLIGLALFLTLFVMSPVISQVNNNAVQPYINGQITEEQALEQGIKPIREFMLKQTRTSDLNLFLSLSKENIQEGVDNLPLRIVVPAFILSEIKTAFEMGFLIYIPFLIIDMVVSSVLMSMGMFMLPPVMISLPFKILLFILVNGWDLIIKSLIVSFN